MITNNAAVGIRGILSGPDELGCRVVRSLLQLSERWPCLIWLVGRMKFTSLEAN